MINLDKSVAHPSSFRDPSGHIFTDQKGVLKRVIFPIYFNTYAALTTGGFYEALIQNKLLVPHKEVSVTKSRIVIQPHFIPFITYPYEWSFDMFKAAALLTLKLQKYSLQNGYTLKDASAFNVTFYKGKPIFIDTLSFEPYTENSPWRAYKQFVMHFLGPLVLAKYTGAKALQLIRTYMDGIPLDMLSKMLPISTKLSPFLISNIHLLAKFERKFNEDYNGQIKNKGVSKKGQLDIITSLYNYIKQLQLKNTNTTEWGNYYNKTNYSETAFQSKANLVDAWVKSLKAETLIDIAGNDGTFVRKITHPIIQALVCDIDNTAVDINYRQVITKRQSYILPFTLDVLNPSPAIGYNHTEREAFLTRIKNYAPDVTLALAVIHHISLTGNIPFLKSAAFFATFSKHLIIEFPKRNDSWVQRLLNSKHDFKDYFDFYNLTNFENAYFKYFTPLKKIEIEASERVIYVLKQK